MIIKREKELQLLTEMFISFGFNDRNASLISKTLVDADCRGIYSHGIQRLTMYERKLNLGFINPNADTKILRSTRNCIVVDAQHVMGQLASIKVVNQLIKVCKSNGIAIATVRNSNHFGAAGYYARMASRKNLIGFAATSTNPLLVPPGATEPFLGSNPFAISFPLENSDFTFDGATSTVSLGKIEVLQKLDKDIPGNWAVD
uniref:Ldh family oxidoreductase n=1 Tax=Liquorilactobacillus vini TaxID=238015 RepID=UPI00054CFA53